MLKFELKVFDSVSDLRDQFGEPYEHNTELLHSVVEREHVMVNKAAQDLLNCITIDSAKSTRFVELRRLSEFMRASREDFARGLVTFGAIYEALHDYGGRCTADTGPRLRLAYVDQPRNERLIVLSDPINMRGQDQVFGLANNDHELYLGTVPAHLDQILEDCVIALPR